MLRYILIYLYTVYSVNGAKIIGVFPTPSISHQVVFRPLMATLAKKGHEVITLTPDPVTYDPNIPNLTQIDVHDMSYAYWTKKFNFAKMREDKQYNDDLLKMFYITIIDLVKMQFSHPIWRNIYDDPNMKFDLCFFESLIPLIFPLKDRFNCSVILISSLPGMHHNFDAFGNPSNPLIYPVVGAYKLDDMNFWERLYATWDALIYRYTYYMEIIPLFEKSAIELFGNNVRSIQTIENEADMLFLNFHPILGGIMPSVPGIIFMGSMHLLPNKPLPKELKNVLDNAKNGVVYMSLGSNVKSIHLSQHRINAFLEAFKELPYTILWKWENETLSGKPENVYISKWYPQQDVLAHPNVKCFITQGGQQSMEEAIHHKVPLIGIPFMGDQDLNVKKMIKFGIGIELNLHTLNKQVITDAVKNIFKKPSYHQNIERLSNLIQDQPQTSIDRAIWWTEYVLRHKGARHLRSPAADIPFYQYFLLDIVAFVLISSIIILTVVIIICRKLYRWIQTSKTKLKSS